MDTEFLRFKDGKNPVDSHASLAVGWHGVGLTLLSIVLLLAGCLLYTSPSPRDATLSRMPSSA